MKNINDCRLLVCGYHYLGYQAECGMIEHIILSSFPPKKTLIMTLMLGVIVENSN